MFKSVNPMVNAFMQASPEQMIHGGMMVSFSIQQPWHSVGKQLIDYRKKGKDSAYVWGLKGKSLAWYEDHGEALYYSVMEAKTVDERLALFLQVDGLGMAKAGFMCQLMFGDGGCMDVHNLRKYDVKASVMNYNAAQGDATRKAKRRLYLSVCNTIGTAELWDQWCDGIAARQPTRWVDGNHVSMVHYTYLSDSYNNVIREG